ncbi:MAG: hypothetical protein HYY94_03025 [Gemmatimonadetes bacterium]|nr:hypothetical protein [Gemmatimonadota bacterium]
MARDLPSHLLALIVLWASTGADVHQLGRHVGVLAEIGEGYGKLREGRQQRGVGGNLLKAGRDRLPPVVAAEVGIAGGAIRREPLDHRVLNTRRGQALSNQLGGRRETGRGMYPVKPRQLPHRLQRRHAVHVRVDRRAHGIRPERDGALLPGQRSSAEHEKGHQGIPGSQVHVRPRATGINPTPSPAIA